MIEIILGLVIAVLCGLLAWEKYESRKERQKMIQAIMSKSAEDMVNFEMAEKVEKIKPTPEPSSLVPEAEMTDAEFEKYVVNEGKPNGGSN